MQGGHSTDDGATTRLPIDESELRLVAPERYCLGCGAKAVSGETFCTSCGRELSNTDPAAVETAVVPSFVLERTLVASTPPVDRPIEHARHRSPLWLGVAVLAAMAVAAAVAFGVLWRSQASYANRLHHRLDTTRAQLAATRVTLSRTQSKLAATSALSARRRAVLLKARAVLTKVDPLLSSVDGVQQQSGNVQSQGSTLSDDAESLIQTTITLVNYLVANGSNSDYTYVNGLIDEANAELNSVRADEVLFASNTAAYDTASTTFGNKADAFSAAVRSLQTQLKVVAGQ